MLFSVEILLKLLYDFDYVDLLKFRGALSWFLDAAGTSTIRPNEDVRAVKVKFAKEFWIARGKNSWRRLPVTSLRRLFF
jgi:hypothetical protein